MVIFTKDSFNISCANCDKEIKISRHNFDIGEPYIYPDSENKMRKYLPTIPANFTVQNVARKFVLIL